LPTHDGHRPDQNEGRNNDDEQQHERATQRLGASETERQVNHRDWPQDAERCASGAERWYDARSHRTLARSSRAPFSSSTPM
jgi:hypothetical protein